MKTRHGNYVQIDGEFYLLSWISLTVKEQVEEFRARVDLLRKSAGCLAEVTRALTNEVNDQHSLFQRIVFLNYTDIGRSFGNAVLLLENGSLADSLTLARPVLEYILDITYLSLYPEAVAQYEAKAEAHNLLVAEGGSAARNPRDNMRFMNSGRMKVKIKEHPDCTDIHQNMLDRYDLVSGVAEHTSPERKTLSLRRQQDWHNVIVVLEDVAFYAFDTLYTADELLSSVAARDQDFEKVRASLQSLRN